MAVDRSRAGSARDQLTVERLARRTAQTIVTVDADVDAAQADATQAIADAAAAQAAADAAAPKGPITGSSLTMNSARMLARTSASTGAIEELTDAQGRTFLGLGALATQSSVAWGTITGTMSAQLDLQAAFDFLLGQVLITLPAVDTAFATALGAMRLYAPGSLSVANGNFRHQVKRLSLVSSERTTLEGDARLCVA